MEATHLHWRNRIQYALVVGMLLFAPFTGAKAQDAGVLRLAEQEVRQAASSKVEPEYPALARQLRVTGDVQVEVAITTAGTVEKVTVVRGNTLLTNAVVSALRRWKFNPFVASSKPVRVVAPMTFNFRL